MLKVISPSEPLFKKPKFNSFKPVLSTLHKVIMPSKIKKINIPTTDLASLCGMDHYNNYNKSICKIWKKLYPIDYEATEIIVRSRGDACSIDNNYKKLAALQKKSGTNVNVVNMVSAVNQKRHTSSNTLTENQSSIASEIKDCSKLTEEQKQQMVKLMNSATNVVFGCRNEGRGIDAFTNITGKTIQAKQNKLVYTFHTDTLADNQVVEWNITGKYDGLTSDNEVVEVKNRQRKLFNEIRDYEMCQIQTYLHILQSDKGFLVEVLGGKKGEENQVNILETVRQIDYYDLVIKSHLLEVCKYALNIPFMSSEDKLKLMSG
jgi:hypothetical protein